jgi:putative two-component system response regulator
MRILIAEDETIPRTILRRFLETWGHEVQEASDGLEALDLISEQPGMVDVLVTDWMMPGMDGLELARRVRSMSDESQYIYIIFLTGRGGAKDLIRGFKEGGVDDYIVKPFDPAELDVRIKVGMRLIKAERQLRRYSENLEKIVSQQTEEIRETQGEMISRLFSALESRDEETGDHVRRIGLFSALFAQKLGWSRAQADEIRGAAPLHDVGKVGISDTILLKPGKLTDEEFAVMKTHTTIGASILNGSHYSVIQMAERIALGHHERWDGRGYPQGLAGEDIPMEARITAVADVFDALSNDRVYRKAMPHDKVMQIMHEGRGSHFDPNVFDVFIDSLPEVMDILKENQ